MFLKVLPESLLFLNSITCQKLGTYNNMSPRTRKFGVVIYFFRLNVDKRIDIKQNFLKASRLKSKIRWHYRYYTLK